MSLRKKLENRAKEGYEDSFNGIDVEHAILIMKDHIQQKRKKLYPLGEIPVIEPHLRGQVESLDDLLDDLSVPAKDSRSKQE
ncbi:MAG: hypothetical protein PVH61_31610 [Candidatus Aminicenantes bacterium]|jgi:hypothetical protein